jgi:hypothetical protein
MNQQLLEGLASQHIAELRAAASRQEVRQNVPFHALRVRTGWTLVHVGLRLAVPPPRRPQVTPRPAGS